METVGVGVDSDSSSRGASLPRFLKPVQPTQSSATQVSVPVHAVYSHKHPFGDAHVLWWPAQTQRVCDSSNKTLPAPRTMLLFIPGTCALLSRVVTGSRSDSPLYLVARARTKKKQKKLLPPPPIQFDSCARVYMCSIALRFA